MSAEHAGDWLLSIPCRQLGTLLPSTDFRFLLKFRLGISPLSAASTCNSCHREFSLDADLAGDHALCCVKSGYVRRHYVLCNHLRYLLTTAGISTSSEVYVDQRKTLRIDLLATAFGEGVSEALDISITHSLTSRWAENAIAEVESKKILKYATACRTLGWNFSPIVLDSFGGLGASSLKLMNKVIAKAAQRSPQPIEATQYYWQRLSMALARAVARQLVLSMA